MPDYDGPDRRETIDSPSTVAYRLGKVEEGLGRTTDALHDVQRALDLLPQRYIPRAEHEVREQEHWTSRTQTVVLVFMGATTLASLGGFIFSILTH